LLNEKKTELTPSSKIKCRKSEIFTNYWVGWIWQSNLEWNYNISVRCIC